MNIAGLTTVDHASQVVAEWLNLLQVDIGWKDRGRDAGEGVAGRGQGGRWGERDRRTQTDNGVCRSANVCHKRKTPFG